MTTLSLTDARMLRLSTQQKRTCFFFYQPPYSPDLGPYDLFLFPELKKMLSGMKYVRSYLGSAGVSNEYQTKTSNAFHGGVNGYKYVFDKGAKFGRFAI